MQTLRQDIGSDSDTNAVVPVFTLDAMHTPVLRIGA